MQKHNTKTHTNKTKNKSVSNELSDAHILAGNQLWKCYDRSMNKINFILRKIIDINMDYTNHKGILKTEKKLNTQMCLNT